MYPDHKIGVISMQSASWTITGREDGTFAWVVYEDSENNEGEEVRASGAEVTEKKARTEVANQLVAMAIHR